MSNQTIRDELRELQQRLETARSNRAEHQPQAPDDASEAEHEESPLDDIAQSVRARFETFAEQLETDLSRSSRSSILTIFALGVLVGRMLPR